MSDATEIDRSNYVLPQTTQEGDFQLSFQKVRHIKKYLQSIFHPEILKLKCPQFLGNNIG